MGNVIQASELSGRKYSFTIAGDEPTTDEQRQIDSIIRQNDAQFIEEYKAEYGVSPTDEGSGFSNQVGEFFKGIGRGGVGLAETSALGTAALLPLDDKTEMSARDFIKSLSYGVQRKIQPDIGLEDSKVGKFGETLGSVAGTYAPAFIPGIGIPLAFGTAVTAGSGEASERALAAGATDAERDLAIKQGAGVGATELLPLGGPIMRRIRNTGGLNRIKRALAQGGIEGAQETAANVLQNLIEQGYNLEQELGEGNLEAAGYGGAAGGTVQFLVDLVRPGRARGTTSFNETIGGSTASASSQIQEQEADDATDTTTDDADSAGTGTGDGDSQPSVARGEGDGSGAESTEDAVSSNDGPVGGGVLSTDGATDTTGVQPDTLADQIKTQAKVQSVEDKAKEKEEEKEEETEEETEEVTSEDESVDMSGLIRKEDDAELDDTTEKATDKSKTKARKEGTLSVGERKNKFSEVTTDTLLAQATTIDGPQGTRFIDPNDPAGLDNDLILQRVNRDAIAVNFYGWKTRNPELGAFHDELVGDREASSPENYLTNKDLLKLNSLARRHERRSDPDEIALTPEEQAAFTFFERFERPETALDEIASRTQIRVSDTAPARVGGKLSGEGKAARAAAFAEPFDQDTAKLAEKWVTDNLAPETTKRYNEQKADVQERLNPKSRKQYKIKTKLQDVEPRPVGRDPESVAAQAEWDAQFADAYTRDGKPKPTQAEAMEAKVKADEQRATERLNEQLDKEQVEQERQERLATGVTLPSEIEGLSTKVVDLDTESSLSKLDRTEFLTKAEERSLNFKDAQSLKSDDLTKNAIAKLEYFRNSMRAKIREDKNLLASLYGEGLTYEDLTQDRDGSLGLPDLFNKKDALLTQFVTDRNRPLDPTVMTMLEDNNLADALRRYAADANPASRMFAKTFAKYAGNTQVRFEDKGEQIAGLFAPRTNTITFNTNVPTTEHTFLHEVGHAVMSSYIANNPQAAPVKTLRKIYDDVKEAFPSAYNFDEFVAEVPSNQQMRTTLSELLDPNRYGTAYRRVIEAIRRIFQRIGFELGGKPPVQKSLLEVIDPLVYKLMEPAPTSRDAAPLFQIAHNPAAVDRLFQDATTNSPVFDETAYNKFEELTKQTPKDWSQDKLGTVKGWVLKATPLHYVTRMAEKFAPSAADINNLVNQSGGELQSGYDKVNQVNDGIVKWANKSSKKNIAAWNRLNNIGTSYQVNPALSEREARDKYSPDMYKVYEIIRKDYKRLQRVDRGEPIRLYHQSQNMFKGLVEDLIRAIDTRLEASGVPEQSRAAIRDTFYTNLIKKGKLEPYTPLQRDGGDYWLSLNAIDPVTGRIERYSDSFQGEQARDRAREAIVADAKQNILNAPEGSPARIALESRTQGMSQMSEADALDDMLAVESTQELDATSFMRRAPNASFVNELMAKLEGSGELTAETKDEIANVILKTLPETSYLQSFRMRKGGDLIKARMGYNEDSMKAIADRSRSLIRQSVNIKYKAKMQQALSKVEKEMNESGGNRIDKNELLNSLRSTVSDGPIPERSKVSRALTGIGFNMTLGMNLSGGLVNLTQIPLVTLPYLSGKYGIRTTMGGIKGAMSLMKNSGGTRTIMGYGTDANNQAIETEVGSGYSISNVNPRNLTRVQRRILNKMGITPEELQVFIDTGVDLGQFKRSLDHEILDVDRMGGFWSKFNKFSGFIQHHTERINREAALFAAYRGALSKLSPQQRANPDLLLKAAQDAVYDTETTNGGIAAAAAPELGRRNLGAVIFMYKRYGVSMIGMLTEMVMKITKGSPADRRLALYQLAGIYGTSGLLAGVYGMPGFGLATTVIDTVMAAMGMDPGGEDDDAKTMARAYLHEGVYRGGVNYFTGVNISSRVGLSELIYRDSMMDRDWPILFRMAEQLGGPVIGIALNTERGLNQILEGAADGDTEKLRRGIETISPAAIKNMQKAARFAREGGAYTMDGKPIVDDIADGHLVAQFFGFSPAAYSAQMATNSQTMRLQKAILRKRRQIYNMYARAYFDGDVEGLQRTAQKIIEYNQRYPQYPILQDNLDKSIRGRIRQRAGAYNGLTLNPRLRNMLVEQAERYGDPTIFD